MRFLFSQPGFKRKSGESRAFAANRPLEFPRGHGLEGSEDGKSWSVLAENPECFPDLKPMMIEDDSKYGIEISFESHEVRYLRIRLTRAHKDYRSFIKEIFCKSR